MLLIRGLYDIPFTHCLTIFRDTNISELAENTIVLGDFDEFWLSSSRDSGFKDCGVKGLGSNSSYDRCSASAFEHTFEILTRIIAPQWYVLQFWTITSMRTSHARWKAGFLQVWNRDDVECAADFGEHTVNGNWLNESSLARMKWPTTPSRIWKTSGPARSYLYFEAYHNQARKCFYRLGSARKQQDKLLDCGSLPDLTPVTRTLPNSSLVFIIYISNKNK